MKLKIYLLIALGLAASYTLLSNGSSVTVSRPPAARQAINATALAITPVPVNNVASAKPSAEAIMTPTLTAPVAAAPPAALDKPLLDLISAPTLTPPEQAAVRDYLIKTNALAFPSPEIITFNILQARDAKPQPLLATVAEILAKTQQLADLTPPASLQEFHNSSIKNLAVYADLLKKISNAGAPANMLTVMNSNEFNQARLESRALVTQLRAIVNKNNIELPTDVLPATPLPTLSTK